MGSPNRTWTITDAYPLTVEMSYSNTAFRQVGQQRIRNAGASTRQLHLPTLAAYVVWSNTGSTEKYLPLPRWGNRYSNRLPRSGCQRVRHVHVVLDCLLKSSSLAPPRRGYDIS
jgi:hypothetical protein